jgi:hypothetical protein
VVSIAASAGFGAGWDFAASGETGANEASTALSIVADTRSSGT